MPSFARPVPIIIDTDIGEDIDDLLVLCFALNSPEFEVLAVTTVDGDTRARSRIARRCTAAYHQSHIPVCAGYTRSMPAANEPVEPGLAVTQLDVAPDETGLPPQSELGADELIARLTAQRPGQVYLLTIGSMTNAGQALVRYPQTARNLAAIVTNGGNFGPERQTQIGWNLRYDPVASATVARSAANWVLLPEGMRNMTGMTKADVDALAAAGLETTDIIMAAIEGWRKNKRECKPDSIPHLSDLRCFAYLLGDIVQTVRGRAWINVGPPGTTAELRIERDEAGPHSLGWTCESQAGQRLHDLFAQRILAKPRV